MPADPQAGDSCPAVEERASALPGVEPDVPAHHGEVPPPAASPADAEEQAPAPAPSRPAPPVPPVVEVDDLDWNQIATSVAAGPIRARMRETVEQLETRLDAETGLRLLFDDQRENSSDRAVRIAGISEEPLWFIGDLHGDLLALEAALALIDRESAREGADGARIVLLGDLFDDGGYGLETLLRVFELMVRRPSHVCLLAGNHDEALGYNGSRFTATVSPSDFSEFLNDHLAHEWIGRVGKLVVRIVADAPRALFFPDGLLVAHGGFPLRDLHEPLAGTGDWNDPRCLVDFVWTRAHPRARRKMPNRTSRGSQFGYEDFAAFCDVSTALGRPVSHMIRGHDHVDERYEIYPAYASTPVLTTVALSRRLAREPFGPYVRVPTVARWIRGALPQVYRLHIPEEHVVRVYPQEPDEREPAPEQSST